ncbi:hypothetical protein L6R52_12170, partial [Myxococcota bacterium]|nr:hypothetical protein [Myxococcota bacterium]
MTRRTLTWAFMVRAGSEHDLVEELGEKHLPEVVADGVVVSASRPETNEHVLKDPAFARQALRLDGPPAPLDPEVLADRLTHAIRARLPKAAKPWTWALQIVPPDSSDPLDPRRKLAAELEAPLTEALLARLPEEVRERREEEDTPNRLVQAWILDEEQALVGVTSTHEAMTAIPGGRVRMRRPDDAPSRAGLKLEEAIAWIGLGPEKGDLCVDLGAAPGGWSQVAVGRGANVIAVDPARIKIDLPRSRFTHVQESAFDFAPSETLDWLLCDMAWRPLEVAKLVAKWGRRVWARQLIANFKLPMKQKAKILAEILTTLEDAGWKGLRVRQLYFDRDEVTVFGWLDPNIARKGAQAPFRLRARKNDEDGAKAEKKKVWAEREDRRKKERDERRPPRAASGERSDRDGRGDRGARDDRGDRGARSGRDDRGARTERGRRDDR